MTNERNGSGADFVREESYIHKIKMCVGPPEWGRSTAVREREETLRLLGGASGFIVEPITGRGGGEGGSRGMYTTVVRGWPPAPELGPGRGKKDHPGHNIRGGLFEIPTSPPPPPGRQTPLLLARTHPLTRGSPGHP